MSLSDSEYSSSSHGGEYKTFRQISRDRLLFEMLQTKSGDSRSSWKVLIMDKVTLKVMSHSCKMADITDQGVSLVEDLFRRREPLPSMDAIYFIQPSKENVVMFLSDMSGREPLYRKAYVYFSTPVPKDFLARIKNDTSVLPRIGGLREMNLEYLSIDSQAFITDHEKALEELFAENAEKSRKFNECLNVMGMRLATVFASLKEFPFVRYKAVKGLDETTATSVRELIPTKVATVVWNTISNYKNSIPNFPTTETCELLILDRSVDQIAPVIHEWTYDAMCHDLLELDGNKYIQEIPSKTGGDPELKEFLLEDHDPVWLEIRHAHIAEASEKLSDKMENFVSKNKAAQLQQREGGGELSTRDLQKMVQALPQYNEQMEKLSLHVEIAGKINKAIRELNLRELGQLEQNLVFGDAATKEVITFLRSKQDGPEIKLRLLMIYACVYPEKFEGDNALKLMQLAKLTPEDMKAVKNMKFLEGSSSKKASHGAFSLKFDAASKKKHAERQDRSGEEETWALFKFYPMIEELIEKVDKGELPKDEYQCMNSSSSSSERAQPATSQAPSAKTGPPAKTGSTAAPIKSRRTATWAKSRASDDGYSSDSALKSASSELRKMGQRIFIFIIGGATRSELRVCHKLTTKLRREVVLGTTSLDDPPQYVSKLKLLTGGEHPPKDEGLGI